MELQQTIVVSLGKKVGCRVVLGLQFGHAVAQPELEDQLRSLQ